MSSPPFFLRDSRASETRACVKITPREKKLHVAGREKNEGPSFFSLPTECHLFSHRVIFTHARILLALLSLRKNGGLLVVQAGFHCNYKLMTTKGLEALNSNLDLTPYYLALENILYLSLVKVCIQTSLSLIGCSHLLPVGGLGRRGPFTLGSRP